MIFLQMERPRPVPWALPYVAKASKQFVGDFRRDARAGVLDFGDDFLFVG